MQQQHVKATLKIVERTSRKEAVERDLVLLILTHPTNTPHVQYGLISKKRSLGAAKQVVAPRKQVDKRIILDAIPNKARILDFSARRTAKASR